MALSKIPPPYKQEGIYTQYSTSFWELDHDEHTNKYQKNLTKNTNH